MASCNEYSVCRNARVPRYIRLTSQNMLSQRVTRSQTGFIVKHSRSASEISCQNMRIFRLEGVSKREEESIFDMASTHSVLNFTNIPCFKCFEDWRQTSEALAQPSRQGTCSSNSDSRQSRCCRSLVQNSCATSGGKC